MDETPTKALVGTILRHAEDFPWKMQDIGLMGLRLDDERKFRLHVWDPSGTSGTPPVHDHPYDFTSTVIAGELTNGRYREHAGGDAFVRYRYPLADENARRTDVVRLSMSPETFTEGDSYSQLASELHASWQQPGTVTLIRCTWHAPSELTVCVADEESWRSGQSRDATSDEVKTFATRALEWF